MVENLGLSLKKEYQHSDLKSVNIQKYPSKAFSSLYMELAVATNEANHEARD